MVIAEQVFMGLLYISRVMGRIYPPEDIWREPDLPAQSKVNQVSSVSKKKKGPKKADSARRLKVTSCHWYILFDSLCRCQGIPGGAQRWNGKRELDNNLRF